jgi:glycosyltransferase involved in cell wall biosynthesis
MKRVLAFTLGANHPSSRLRIAEYQEAFTGRGWELRMHYFDAGMGKSPARSASPWTRAVQRLRRARATAKAAAALRGHGTVDPIIISREIPVSRSIFLSAPNPMILDVDDALYLGPGRERLHELSRRAQTVVCGNGTIAQELAGAARSCVVIPTVVDTSRYVVKSDHRPPGPLRAGWLGSSMSIDETLAPLLPTLVEARREVEFELVIVSDEAPSFARGIDWARFVPWSPEVERSIAEHMDVGLMPLQDTPYQAAKCGAKLVQYMAAGLPAIATPLGVNRDLVTDGSTGFWAQTPEDWRRALGHLAGDDALRKRLGQAGRERAVRDFSVARWAADWVNVFERAGHLRFAIDD